MSGLGFSLVAATNRTQNVRLMSVNKTDFIAGDIQNITREIGETLIKTCLII